MSETTVAPMRTAVLTAKSYFVLATKNSASGKNSMISLMTSLVDEDNPLSTTRPLSVYD